jgi:hypothetical protein
MRTPRGKCRGERIDQPARRMSASTLSALSLHAAAGSTCAPSAPPSTHPKFGRNTVQLGCPAGGLGSLFSRGSEPSKAARTITSQNVQSCYVGDCFRTFLTAHTASKPCRGHSSSGENRRVPDRPRLAFAASVFHRVTGAAAFNSQRAPVRGAIGRESLRDESRAESITATKRSSDGITG